MARNQQRNVRTKNWSGTVDPRIMSSTTPTTTSTNTTPVSPYQQAYESVTAQNNPYTQAAQATTQGNILGAQAATAANRVNQVTPYGNLTYTQTGTDAQGNPIWSATQSVAPELQQAYQGLIGGVNAQAGQAFNPNLPSMGINPGETYSDAIMRRLQPMQQQQSEGLDVQLANQGIMPGSEAYNRAKTQLAQQQNDQLTSAVVGGFNTGMQANQQAYNQALTNYQLPTASLSQFRNATNPNYVNPYSQAAVSGPDYLGAYNASQNYNIAEENAKNAAKNNIYSGLLGLAGSAIQNPTGLSNLGTLAGQGLGAIGTGLGAVGTGISGGLNALGNAASGLFSS